MILELKNFQENCVDFLLKETEIAEDKKKIIIESPTGSGKTIILLAYIERYLEMKGDVVFVWLTPGKGELEEQSKEKMERFCPTLSTGALQNVITSGFEDGTTYFINWETVTKKGNKAIEVSERKNLFERIIEAHKSNKTFIIIIDEEHQNDTKKADDIITALDAAFEIRVSATPTKRANHVYYRIDETDVINEELITKAMHVNYELDTDSVSGISHETDLLLEKADAIRCDMQAAYIEEGEDVRPLVLIQFPNMKDALIEQVENTLADMGYTYKNKMVASWFSAESSDDKKSKHLGKINIGTEGEKDSITKHDATPVFLLFKQALSTGWDCPRAKILVKLRENMNETFEIQTLGRLRRMPKARHYGRDILDCSYLYTFDEDYKLNVLNEGAYEAILLFLKDAAKDIKLVKEVRGQDASYVDDVKIRQRTYDFFKMKNSLSNNKSDNQRRMENSGYIFGTRINRSFLTGRYIKLKDIGQDASQKQNYYIEVNTHDHGIDRQHIINDLKKYVGLSYEKINTILRNLFLRGAGNEKAKLTNLSIREFTAFIINNEKKLKEDFAELDALRGKFLQQEVRFHKEDTFSIPREEVFRYKPYQSHVKNYNKNVYKDYNTSMTVEGLRSKPERLFESYCERSDKVKMLYKNGDKGVCYLSVLYSDYLDKQNLFYPDYIVVLEDNTVFLAETKGGEIDGQSKNIDRQILNKYNYFKDFCERHGYPFGFVRDKNDRLYVCDGEFDEDMNNAESWKPIEDIL